MIISLRATNGAGKTYVVRTLFDQCKPKPIYSLLGHRRPEAYMLKLPKVKEPLYVLGPYLIGSGGCDGIQPYDLILDLIEKYAVKGHVLFEGVIVTSVYGRIGAMLEQWGKDSVFLFLDTPLEECIKRIESRRKRGRDDRLIKNVSAKYQSAVRVREKVGADGIMQAITVSTDEAPKMIAQLLQRAKWPMSKQKQ
jgi:hypothetical protein